MELNEYLAKIKKLCPYVDIERIRDAYLFGEEQHKDQMRKSGEKYFIHPIAVSIIMAELGSDEDSLVACLLHDVVEDTDITAAEIAERYGDDVAMLVEGVTKLGKIHYESKEEMQADNLRKMFLAMAKDIRVILIKLSDRLHNMRTLKYMPDAKKKEKAEETIEIYAPVAHRLGIFKMKSELEDLALLYLHPDIYYDLVAQVKRKRNDREKNINNVIAELNQSLRDFDIECEIYGRPKNFYSIYKKMYLQQKDFNEIYDLTAIRVIVDSVKDCYGVLGVIHTLWKPIPGRFKDYIAMPKQNLYRSLHTTVISNFGEPFEIQVRTKEMHMIAEYGIAAHFQYKEGISNQDAADEKLVWLRQMREFEKDVENTEEYVDSVKGDIFDAQVYVFTPQGKVVELPDGSTPVDFAYKIHSEVGNKCVGAKVNSRICPLNVKLTNGAIVEIMTSKSSNGPSRDWLKFVKSAQAKNKIKQWFKKERREENITNGKDMLEKEIKRSGIKVSELMKPEWLEPLMNRLSLSTIDDLYNALGYGGILTNQVIPKLKEKYKDEQKKNMPAPTLEDGVYKAPDRKFKGKKRAGAQGIVVKGVDNLLTRFAKCCSPVPGDEIIGFITRGRGVTVHRADCPNFEKGDDVTNRFIEVAWATDQADTEEEISFSAEISIISPDKKGLLGLITSVIAEANLVCTGINARVTKDDVAIMNLVVETTGTQQLVKLINRITALPDVIEVKRIKG